MALRQFRDRTGCCWNVWTVEPTALGRVDGPLQDGWLCFQRAEGGERLRMARGDVPPAWEELPDERLDLLRRVAVLAPQTGPMQRVVRTDGDEVTDAVPDLASRSKRMP